MTVKSKRPMFHTRLMKKCHIYLKKNIQTPYLVVIKYLSYLILKRNIITVVSLANSCYLKTFSDSILKRHVQGSFRCLHPQNFSWERMMIFCMTRSVILKIAVQSTVHSARNFCQDYHWITSEEMRYSLINPVCWSV